VLFTILMIYMYNSISVKLLEHTDSFYSKLLSAWLGMIVNYRFISAKSASESKF